MSKAPIAFNFDDMHNITFDVGADTPVNTPDVVTGNENYVPKLTVDVLPGVESLVEESAPLDQKIDLYNIAKFRMLREDDQESRESTRLHVKTTDGINFRLYINGNTYISSPAYINKFLQFMNSRSSGQTVTIHLGVMMYSLHIFDIGAILDAITKCKAKIITFAGGHCGCPESVIWTHGHTRIFGKYGVLQFDGGLYLEEAPFYKGYFDTLLNKAKEVNILTEEQVEFILKDNKTIYVYPK